MFDTEDHRPYVALCRELRLERTHESWEDGDVFVVPPGWTPEVCHGGWMGDRWISSDWDTFHQHAIWLPRLDQWLAMLEEAGVEYVDIGVAWVAPANVCAELVAEGAATKTFYAFDSTAIPDKDDQAEYPSREEAAARLWCAVTGRAVTA